MGIGFKRHTHSYGSSGYVDPKCIDKDIEAILAEVKIDRKHDVPYCAGYSQEWDDNKTIYIDKEVPETFNLKSGPCDVTRYLCLHEAIEKTLMDELGLGYEGAHAIATAAEESAVRADGHSVEDYNAQWDKIIRKVGSRGSYKNIPADLDTEPYSDEGDDAEVEEGDEPIMGGKAMYGC